MRIYFSGGGKGSGSPNALIPERNPHVMLSYYEKDTSGVRAALKSYYRQKVLGEKAGFGSIFVDSGAYAMRNNHISFFDLRRGKEFRSYCDGYARWIRGNAALELLTVTVDAIGHPDKTWEIQEFFWNEHGLAPVPVIHPGTPLTYLERYLETGRHDLVGIGGLGQRHTTIKKYIGWADEVFSFLCPKSNNRLPIVKTHGFAMTSHTLMCRYPFWSVDSTTWLLPATRGWVYMARWSSKIENWDYSKIYRRVNFSWRSPEKRKRRQHYTNLTPTVRSEADRWIAQWGFDIGSIMEDRCGLEVEGSPDDFTVEEDFEHETSLSHSGEIRTTANLHYWKNREERFPEWPHPFTF